MYELKKFGKLFTSKFVGTGPSSYKKKNLPGRGLTKVEKHWSRPFRGSNQPFIHGRRSTFRWLKRRRSKIYHSILSIPELKMRKYMLYSHIYLFCLGTDFIEENYIFCFLLTFLCYVKE
jgi:hypothetical protein